MKRGFGKALLDGAAVLERYEDAQPLKQRSWWRRHSRVCQFSLRWFLLAVLVVAVFFAGKASSLHRAEQAEIEKRLAVDKHAALLDRMADMLNLHSPEFADDLKTRVERLDPKEIPPDTPGKLELLESMGMERERLLIHTIYYRETTMTYFILSSKHVILFDNGIEIVDEPVLGIVLQDREIERAHAARKSARQAANR